MSAAAGGIPEFWDTAGGSRTAAVSAGCSRARGTGLRGVVSAGAGGAASSGRSGSPRKTLHKRFDWAIGAEPLHRGRVTSLIRTRSGLDLGGRQVPGAADLSRLLDLSAHGDEGASEALHRTAAAPVYGVAFHPRPPVVRPVPASIRDGWTCAPSTGRLCA